jgi:small-conductance mechanosensitive channel
MNLVFAIFVFDIGSCTRSIASWSWRHFYGTDTANTQINLMWAFGGILVIVGALCKIRALTYPDHGNRPWLASAGLTAIVLLGLILWH